MNALQRLLYSFPVRLFLLQLKKNHILLLIWLILFAIVLEQFGKVFGIPHLFLHPEYLGQSGFWSFYIVGITLGGFIMAFQISCYILDGPRYAFLGTLRRPFTKFFINNSIIPAAFLVVYFFKVFQFQTQFSLTPLPVILLKLLGLLLGIVSMFSFLFLYFRLTNKDIFKIVAGRVEKELKKAKITRVNVMRKWEEKNQRERVEWYWDERFRIKTPGVKVSGFDKEAILKVFDQNHLNSVIIQMVIILVILVLGKFRDNPIFQIPAAASAILLFTVVVMLGGAMSFWFRKWATTALILFVFLLNILVKLGFLSQPYQAFGLNYDTEKQKYDLQTLRKLHGKSEIEADRQHIIKILDNWKNKQPGSEKPPLIILAGSGGGLRAALWNFHVIQQADLQSGGALMTRTALITGSSGGLMGSAYYRELFYRKQLGENMNPHDTLYRRNLSKDLLNPIIFTLIVNDFFFIRSSFDYKGKSHIKERGYAFEQQFNANTGGILDRALVEYREPEYNATIPMLFMSPAVINDGRKLYISPHSLSFLTDFEKSNQSSGMDFQRLFKNHGADSLRFLTALRTNATFPIISPNVTLPTVPVMEIMDSGLTDNFGISDALDFVLELKNWIEENTSGVVLVSVRDTERIPEVSRQLRRSLFQKVTVPFSVLANNWSTQQDFRNDEKWHLTGELLKVPMERIEFQSYDYLMPVTQEPEDNAQLKKQIARASLSWHLTDREKQSIIDNLDHPRNQAAFRRLIEILTHP
jgi:hypothetical protein